MIGNSQLALLKPNLPLYVIADLHLGGGSAATEGLFYAFLKSLEPEENSLLILGDLFEVWTGDDVRSPLSRKVADKLKALSQTGTAIYFVHGNRDFLIKQSYADACGMVLLDEPAIISDTNPTTGFIHGDALCTGDKAFQRFRQKSRSPSWQRRILSLPRFLREWLGKWARWRSRQHGRRATQQQPTIADVNPEEVSHFMQRHDISRLVHGHTHRLAVHPEPAGPGTQRWVLSDWHDGRGSVIILAQTNASMHTIELMPSDQIQWSTAPVPPLAR